MNAALAPRHTVWAAVLTNTLLVQVVTFAVRPATIYRAIEVGLPAAMLGVLAASFALTPLLLALPSGAVVDRLGERVVALLGAVGLVGACLVLFLGSRAALALFGGTVLLGIGHLFCVLAQQTWVANLPGGLGHDTAFGRYTFAASLGQAIGPGSLVLLGGGAVRPETDRILLFGVLTALGVLVTAPLMSRAPARPRTAATSGSSTRELLRRPGLPLTLLTSCVVLAAVDIMLAYLPALGVERGIPSATVGALLVVRATASMCSRLGLGRIVRAVGRRTTMVSFTVTAGVALGLVALTVPTWVLFAAVALAGLGLGVGQPLTMAWLAEAAPDGARGRAMSLRLLGNRAGQVVFPSAAGAVAAGAGASGVLGVTAVALGVIGWVAHRLPLDTP